MSQAADSTDTSTLNRLQSRLMRDSGKAIQNFNMIEDGDTVMVCLSGGKDSYTMLDLLLQHQRRAPIKFELIPMNLDQRQPGYPEHILPEYLEAQGLKFHIEVEDTYSVVMDKIPEGKTLCSLCSRLRRGIIYRVAKELGANKIALGHHRDDILETFFLNLFHGGRLKSMPPKLLSDNKEHVVIRPLAYCKEAEIEAFARLKRYPIIPCNLCGTQQNLQRQVVKGMLAEWEKIQPGRSSVMFRALQNTSPSHLLDKELFDFVGLSQVDGLQELDTAFD